MPGEERDKEFVDALARGLAVIEAFDTETPEMSLTEVARKTGHTPAAARRSIFTLIALGYVSQLGRKFMLTPKVLLLGSAYLRSTHIEDALLPELRNFVEQFGDAASVGVLNDANVLYIAHHSAPSGIRPVAGTGASYPAHATSMGRVLMASWSNADLNAFLKETPLRRLTDATVTEPEAFRKIIEAARRDRYTTSVDQLAYGVTSLAVPITLRDGEVVAAINTSGYTGRLTPESLTKERLPALRECANRIAAIMDRYPALRGSLRLPARTRSQIGVQTE